jgi:hypothetical protein
VIDAVKKRQSKKSSISLKLDKESMNDEMNAPPFEEKDGG